MSHNQTESTPKDFADTETPITAWAFYEVFERKHCGKGWLRAQMGKLEHDLTTALESLAELHGALIRYKGDVECNACGSRNLTWHCNAQNRGGVQDGRIKMNEVGVIFFLGCDECSETVRIIDGDAVAVVLTASLSANRSGSKTGQR